MNARRAAALFTLLSLAACAAKKDEPRSPPDPSAFADRAVSLWDGTAYAAGGDGTYGIDGAGTVHATLRAMGFAVPRTTADGLHDNYYTSGGVEHAVGLTRPSGASDVDLGNGVFTGLKKGDLVFLDYDFDFAWDHVVVYLGVHGAITHAVFNASDYYSVAVISDMEDPADPFSSDLTWSNVTSRELDGAAIADL